MKHVAYVQISQSEFDRINYLLAIDSLSEMTDAELRACGANTDECEGIFYVNFDDGSALSYDLCSGQENYFDDVTWHSSDGDWDVCMDCTYELGSIEFEADGEEYVVVVIPIDLS